MGDHALYAFIENHFKHEHDWVVGNMRYTFDIIVVSIGIIGSFQLVSILTFFFVCILIYFLWMYALTSNSINFDWYLTFHTYICFVCAYYIPIS